MHHVMNVYDSQSSMGYDSTQLMMVLVVLSVSLIIFCVGLACGGGIGGILGYGCAKKREVSKKSSDSNVIHL